MARRALVLRSALLVLLLGLILPACGPEPGPRPPRAKRVPHVDVRHGVEIEDPYHWLRNRDDPEVIAHLEAENRYADAILEPTKSLRDELYAELKGRIKETDLTVPERIDDYWYYTRTEEGRDYRIHCRKRGGLEAEEEVLLDANELAEGHDYFGIGVFRVSPDHRWLAYSVDTDGAERMTIRIKDLETGETLPERIGNTSYSVRWANDNRTLFYNVRDPASRPYRAYRHVRGTDPAEDTLVFEEADERFGLGIDKTKDREYLLFESGSNTTTEIRYLDADQPEGALTVFAPRKQGVEYYLSHQRGSFLVVTNEEAVNFRLLEVPVSGEREPVEIIPHREDVTFADLQVFADFLVVAEREGGFVGLRVRDLESGEWHRVKMPERAAAIWPTRNPDPDTTKFRFRYTSLLTPLSVVEYDMRERKREVLKVTEVRDYDPTKYRTERISATAPDGTKVPISLLLAKDRPRDGTGAMVLGGYGAYGSSSDPTFSTFRLALVDRGVDYAIAHVRGGGEMGRRWYEDGKYMKKMNTFTDFVACAEHLVEEGYAAPERIACRGGSAGGLLVGAAVNLRPDLFRAVVADVPFVDVVNTMSDPSIPLTAGEWEEWGDPRIKAEYEAIRAWSPYENVAEAPYPEMLVIAGLNDPRVGYWEPAKWAARLRERTTGEGVILLKTNMGAGHGGASGRYDRMRENAVELAFLLTRLSPGKRRER